MTRSATTSTPAEAPALSVHDDLDALHRVFGDAAGMRGNDDRSPSHGFARRAEGGA